MTCLHRDILEKAVTPSKIFEGECLLPFAVKAFVQTTIADLTDYCDDDYDNIAIYNGFFQSLTTKKYQDISLKVIARIFIPLCHEGIEGRDCDSREGCHKSSCGKDHRDA